MHRWARLKPTRQEPQVLVRVKWHDGWRQGVVTHLEAESGMCVIELDEGKGALTVEQLESLLVRDRKAMEKEAKRQEIRGRMEVAR